MVEVNFGVVIFGSFVFVHHGGRWCGMVDMACLVFRKICYQALAASSEKRKGKKEGRRNG